MSKIPHPNPRKNFLGIYRFSAAGFLVSLVLLMVALPFVQRLEHGNFAETVLMTLVLGSAVLAVGHRRRVLWWAVVLVLPPISGKWLFHFWHDPILWEIYLAGSMVFVIFIIIQLLRFILRSPRVNSEVLCAGISTYLTMGLWWALAYGLAAYQDSGAFLFEPNGAANPAAQVMKGFTAIYFSFVTLSTVGYGDITPVSDVARMLAAAEAMTGTLFVAVLISRLVSMYSSQPPPQPEK